MINREKTAEGFTLIEVLVYIALFSIVIGGFLVVVYQTTDSHNRTQRNVFIQEEGNFILHKIDHALTGVAVISAPAVNSTGETLTLMSGGSSVSIRLRDGQIQVTRNGGVDWTNLTSDSVKASELSFNRTDPDGTSGKPESVVASFKLDGRYFETAKYLRQ